MDLGGNKEWGTPCEKPPKIDAETLEVLEAMDNPENSGLSDDQDSFFANFSGNIRREYTTESLCFLEGAKPDKTIIQSLSELKAGEVLKISFPARRAAQELDLKANAGMSRHKTKKKPKILSLEEIDTLLDQI